jgi:hypothetical protein
VHFSSQVSILRALFLLGALATVSSCHAAAPENQSPQIPVPHETPRKARPTPGLTAAPTFTPTSSTPTPVPSPTPTAGGLGPGSLVLGPIEILAPREPVQIEAQIKSIEVKPFEIKPVEVRFPKEPVQFSAAPFEMKWPQEPLKVSVDIKGGTEKQQRLARSCECDPALTASRKENAESNERKLREELDALKKELDERKKVEKKILDEAEQQRKDLEARRAAGQLPDPEYQKRLKHLDEDTTKKMNQVADDAWRRMFVNALLVILYLACFGALGGYATAMVDSIKRKRRLQERLATVTAAIKAAKGESAARETNASESKSDTQQAMEKDAVELGELLSGMNWMPGFSEGLPAVVLGIVAALIVPIGMLFIPGVRLQNMSADPFKFASLCSLCFAVAMIGEPFIDFVLQKLRNLTTQSEKPADATSSGEDKTSEPPSSRGPKSSI